MPNSKKCSSCVCYQPPSCDSGEWLQLFTTVPRQPQTTKKFKSRVISIFLTLLGTLRPFFKLFQLNPFAGSAEFKEVSIDFFLHQVNMHPARLNHILGADLTSPPENIGNFWCIPPSTMGISTDHHLLFFLFQLQFKSSGCDKRTIFDSVAEVE